MQGVGKSQRIVLCSRPLTEDVITNQRTEGGRKKVEAFTEHGKIESKHAASS